MADTFSPEKRSEVMRQVKSGRNKSTELKLILWFKENGIKGWRRSYPIKGKPDFVFLRQRVDIFADGCFWHGHNCRNTRPEQNKDYWTVKRARNVQRDQTVTAYLQNKGWTVTRIWECEIKKNSFVSTLYPLLNKI